MNISKSLKFGFSLLLPLVLLGCGAQAEPPKKAAKPVSVDIVTMETQELTLSNELPARIAAIKEAEVRPQVTGILKARLFEEGSYVTSGDVLYQLDPTTYQAKVNSAKAQLTKALAAQDTTGKVAKRYTKLLSQSLISQQLFDDAESAYLQAKADVAISQAELEFANIELSYTQIKAPISGIVGLSEVSEGSLLTAEQSSYLTTIIQSDAVYVDMQQSSVSLYKLKQEFGAHSSEHTKVPVTVMLEDGTAYPEQGYLEFTDAKVNDSTGSVTLRAVMPNKQHVLLQGMFVRAKISLPESRDYLVVPQSTVIRSQSGEPSVFIVNEAGVAEKTAITLGKEVGNGWIVESGLAAGDKVIVSNLMKVRNLQSVAVDTDVSKSSQLTAKL